MRQQEPLEIHGEAVERVSEFTYLGSIINQTAGTDDDITATIRKAQTTFSMLMPVWNEKVLDCKQSSEFSIQVCPSVRFGNPEIDETADQDIADINEHAFQEDPEYR